MREPNVGTTSRATFIEKMAPLLNMPMATKNGGSMADSIEKEIFPPLKPQMGPKNGIGRDTCIVPQAPLSNILMVVKSGSTLGCDIEKMVPLWKMPEATKIGIAMTNAIVMMVRRRFAP